MSETLYQTQSIHDPAPDPETNPTPAVPPAATEASVLLDPMTAPPRWVQQKGGGGGDFNFAIPTNQEAMKFAHHVHGKESWKTSMLDTLHTRWFQYTMIGLLLTDVLILFLELWLLAEYPPCTIIERDAISCCPPVDVGEARRFLSDRSSAQHHAQQGEGGGESHYCPYSAEASAYTAGCDPHKWTKVHKVEQALFIMTITILSVFLLENLIEMVVLTPLVYFRQLFFVIDFFIITVSITLELIFHFHDDEALQSLIGLLVLGRIWRFVRIAHGLIEVTAELASHKYNTLLDHTRALEAKLKRANISFTSFHESSVHSNDRDEQTHSHDRSVSPELNAEISSS